MSRREHQPAPRTGGSGRPGRARRAVTGLLVAASVLVTGACAQIPQDGGVQRGDVTITDPGPVYLQPRGPRAGAGPEEIVAGFLSAQAGGVYEDWVTAREFLDEGAAQAWDPTVRTVVMARDPELDQVSGPTDETIAGAPTDLDDGSETDEPAEPVLAEIRGQVAVTSQLDAEGRYTEATVGTLQDLSFSLEQQPDGQWRITGTEDGTFMSDSNFSTIFRQTSLYFPSRDGEFLVPDVRWYPSTNTAAHAVNGVLAGPSEWLRDSVSVVAPEGTRLVLDSVVVDEDGTASVDLSQEVLGATDDERAMLRAQLEAVLLRVSGVRAVEVTVNSAPLDIRTRVDPTRDPMPALASPLVLSGEAVSTVSSSGVEPVEGLLSLAGSDPTALAISVTGAEVVYRSGRTTIRTAATTAEPSRVLLTGKDLVAPSIDRFGWTWSGDMLPGSPLQVVSPDGVVTAVAADWLDGRSVVSIQVSRDGARIAVVSRDGTGTAGQTRIDVAGIVRGDTDIPVRLSDALVAGAAVVDASQVVWVDESTLAVLAQGQTSGVRTVHLVPLAAHSEALSGVEGAEWIASGRGRRAVYVVTTDGELLNRATTGATWTRVAQDVELPTFPG